MLTAPWPRQRIGIGVTAGDQMENVAASEMDARTRTGIWPRWARCVTFDTLSVPLPPDPPPEMAKWKLPAPELACFRQVAAAGVPKRIQARRRAPTGAVTHDEAAHAIGQASEGRRGKNDF